MYFTSSKQWLSILDKISVFSSSIKNDKSHDHLNKVENKKIQKTSQNQKPSILRIAAVNTVSSIDSKKFYSIKKNLDHIVTLINDSFDDVPDNENENVIDTLNQELSKVCDEGVNAICSLPVSTQDPLETKYRLFETYRNLCKSSPDNKTLKKIYKDKALEIADQFVELSKQYEFTSEEMINEKKLDVQYYYGKQIFKYILSRLIDSPQFNDIYANYLILFLANIHRNAYNGTLLYTVFPHIKGNQEDMGVALADAYLKRILATSTDDEIRRIAYHGQLSLETKYEEHFNRVKQHNPFIKENSPDPSEKCTITQGNVLSIVKDYIRELESSFKKEHILNAFPKILEEFSGYMKNEIDFSPKINTSLKLFSIVNPGWETTSNVKNKI